MQETIRAAENQNNPSVKYRTWDLHLSFGCARGLDRIALGSTDGQIDEEGRRIMKSRRAILFAFLLGVFPILLVGCNGNTARTALLTLSITPSVIAVNVAINTTYTVSELEGVGVTLNYIRFEDYDLANNLLNTYELHEPYASAKFQSILGAYYMPGHATLSGTGMEIYTWVGRRVYTFGGLDDNGYTVEASAELVIEAS